MRLVSSPSTSSSRTCRNVTSKREVRFRILISNLNVDTQGVAARPNTHVVHFDGEHPCTNEGVEIAQIKHQFRRHPACSGPRPSADARGWRPVPRRSVDLGPRELRAGHVAGRLAPSFGRSTRTGVAAGTRRCARSRWYARDGRRGDGSSWWRAIDGSARARHRGRRETRSRFRIRSSSRSQRR